MKTLRSIAFWSHFVFALVTGAVIAVMAATGIGLAFREQIVSAAEKPVARVTRPTAADPMPLSDLLKAVREARPDAQAQMVTVARDPEAAVQVSLGRGDLVYVDPYRGDLHPAGHQGLRDFFDGLEHVHRWFGLTGSAREVGKAVANACCAVYLFLLLSGLYLWWPRSWRFSAFRTAATPRPMAKGKARDWNWHTTAGFWASPILLLTTVTGLFMAYPKLADLLGGKGGATPVPAVQAAIPAASLSLDKRLASVEAAYPRWQTIMVRMGTRGPGRPGQAQVAQARGGAGPSASEGRPRGEGRGRVGASFVVKESGSVPSLMREVSFDPHTGKALPAEQTAVPSLSDRVRGSVKQFHLGQAGGPAGQAIVCLGGCVTLLLVYTGFALAWRRLFGGRGAAAGTQVKRPHSDLTAERVAVRDHGGAGC